MNNKVVVFYISSKGKALAEKIADFFPEADIFPFSYQKLKSCFYESRAIIFIGASGIAVRKISPLLEDKKKDPAVLVLDEAGRFVISLVSGHLGGANSLAREIAACLNSTPVITTASDISELPALDLWAKKHELIFEPEELIPKTTSRYIEEKGLKVYTETKVPLLETFELTNELEEAHLVVGYHYFENFSGLYARPKRLIVGMGFHEGVSEEKLFTALKKVFEKHRLSLLSIKKLATLERKAKSPGFKALAQRLNAEALAVTPKKINVIITQAGLKDSMAKKHTEVRAVAEPAALSGSQGDRLLIPKQKQDGVTIAVAEIPPPPGKLWVVGLGPGSLEELTPRARKALRQAEKVVGYKTYVTLVEKLLQDKEVFTSGMTQEVDRVTLALNLALEGFEVALVSGGDPGIYGMAGLVFELMKEKELMGRIPVEIIPGITSASAGAARLGAPLMHDFACISLSDRLTPWEIIEKRLRAAAQADFVIVLYNPRSKGRKEHLARAKDIILEFRPEDTPVGIAKAIGRKDESLKITTLTALNPEDVDMQTTVFIGSSSSFILENLMVTPRGYKGKRY
ncbi:precorrin-3B C17-methyltransferase [Thermodesulfatator indicus DSM 15286]|uniref:Precorrin-3B C17-methyltransferase n=1 Tax=Thermodesulfatator indicus (strain DSM 15286 / JCM 11887 / CIR29812) TaxID=667014 RepID=F8ACB5_THEID|nr:precorrin-3B C(17)-methyltransferase [Thermodesulfatator indicus]AEH45752.1 precorrin-3B C17-methyltransferase [Thermodesulfatator indicus DSM 15286]